MKILLAFLLLLTWQQSTTNTPIKIGIVIPSEGALTKAGDASRAALEAYLAEINSQGGLNGRKLELRVALLDKNQETAAVNLKRLTGEDPVIAFVGGITAGREQEVGEFMRTEGVPLIGPATLTAADSNRYVFLLLPGEQEEARAAVNFAASKPDLMKSQALIFCLSGSVNQAGADAAEAQAKKLGWVGVNKIVQTERTLNAVEAVADIKRRGVQTVFVFGNAALKAILAETASAGLTPTFFVSGYSVTTDTYPLLTPNLKNKFFFSIPTIPGDITAIDEYRALQSKYKLPGTSLVSQLLTLSAAKVMIEGLRQSGGLPADSSKGLDVKAAREQLINGLEKVSEFNTGWGPRLTFAKDRRMGSLRVHMIAVDPETKQMTPVGFVSAN